MPARTEPAAFRIPKNHRFVLDIVTASGIGRHLTMSDVYGEAQRRRPGIGHSTVYRALVRLRDLGLISEIVVPGQDAATYEPSGPQHAHFHCSACGTIEDVAYVLPPRVLRDVAARGGFDVRGGTVTFAGRCAACRTTA